MSVVRYERADVIAQRRVLPGCTGKAALTRKVAMTAAERIRARGFATRAYGCIFCGHWHVGGGVKA